MQAENKKKDYKLKKIEPSHGSGENRQSPERAKQKNGTNLLYQRCFDLIFARRPFYMTIVNFLVILMQEKLQKAIKHLLTREMKISLYFSLSRHKRKKKLFKYDLHLGRPGLLTGAVRGLATVSSLSFCFFSALGGDGVLAGLRFFLWGFSMCG